MFLHITSLPSNYGIGSLGKEAFGFVDFLAESGQKIWQILPLGYLNSGALYSPYTTYSAYAGNPLLIDIDTLIDEGYLEKEDLNGLDFGDNEKFVDFGKVENTREILFQKAFENFSMNNDFEEFLKLNSYWLKDFSAFMVNKCGNEPQYYQFLQYLFFKQWQTLKEYANSKGVEIFGDLPIYVSFDSADVEANSELFLLDEDKKPVLVAGVPPDVFSADGQKWGNPLYDWEKLKATNYKWWIDRIKQAFTLYDIVRIDHFRAFDEYFAIPIEDENALNGKWFDGPKEDFFDCLKREIPNANIVEEDLGIITDSVRELLDYTGFAGMKVLQFAFGSDCDNLYLPHNHTKNSIVYTGTHDNNTTKGWLDTVNRQEFSFAVEYLRLDSYEKYTDGFIRAALGSVADTAIIPLADWLDLSEDARMNTPGTIKNNWVFRITKEQFGTKDLSKKMLSLSRLYGRL